MIGLPLVILRSLTARENGGRVLFNHLHIDSTGRWKKESGTLPFKRGNDMSAIKSIGAALLVASLTACGDPARFVIQGYPGAELAPAKTFTVKSQDNWMKLTKLDGKKGKFIPIRSGPAAYAGFEVHLLPGVHQLEVYCWIEPNPNSGATYSDRTTIEVDGQAGQTQVISCTPENGRMHFAISRNAVSPQ